MMNKRETADYYDDLQRGDEAAFDRRVRDEQASYVRVCGGSNFGRHRFTTRKTADGRLICDFCMQPRLEGQS